VLQNAAEVASAADFSPFALPSFDASELERVLAAGLPDVEQAALDAVSAHFASLGKEAETWVSRGMMYARVRGRDECPFCARSLEGIALVEHYRAYFSEAYRKHKEKIAEAREDIRTRFSGDNLARVQRRLTELQNLAKFWKAHADVPPYEIDAESLAHVWTTARELVLSVLYTKASAPLEPLTLEGEPAAAIEAFKIQALAINEISVRLESLNPQLALVRERASQGSLPTAKAHLARLQAMKQRYTPELNAACSAYLLAKRKKEDLDSAHKEARKALDEQRQAVF
jgi:wobble nucleotide-excising tRNase